MGDPPSSHKRRALWGERQSVPPNNRFGRQSDQRPLVGPTLMRQNSLDGLQQGVQSGSHVGQHARDARSESFSAPPLMRQNSMDDLRQGVRSGSQVGQHDRDTRFESFSTPAMSEGELEKLRRMVAVITVMYGVYAAILVVASRFNGVNRSISMTRNYERHAFMTRLTVMSEEDCYSQLRMGREAFNRLVQMLRDNRCLRDTWYTTVEEKVAKFLYLIGQNARTRNVKFMFFRSTETVSRHFHEVLKSIISLHEIFLRQQDGSQCPPEIMGSPKFFPFFKDCIGALDGSHFRVKVPNDVVKRYRGRKDFPTQNVLAVCTFDLKFSYVLPGWEGSASDARVLNNALTRDLDRLVVPRGKYYLADAGYQLKTGFLTPYRSTRYHLKEFDKSGPQNHRELFNLRHASLRNAIERAFGVLKKRFPILGSGTEPYYPVKTQADIVLAGCILHNYLMGVDPNEALIAEVDAELNEQNMSNETQEYRASKQTRECREGETLRERIACAMWTEYRDE